MKKFKTSGPKTSCISLDNSEGGSGEEENLDGVKEELEMEWDRKGTETGFSHKQESSRFVSKNKGKELHWPRCRRWVFMNRADTVNFGYKRSAGTSLISLL